MIPEYLSYCFRQVISELLVLTKGRMYHVYALLGIARNTCSVAGILPIHGALCRRAVGLVGSPAFSWRNTTS